jgi:hypothetical protein
VSAQPTQAEIVEAIACLDRMTDALQLDGDAHQNEAVNEDHDAVRAVLDWAQGIIPQDYQPVTLQPIVSLSLGDRVRVVTMARYPIRPQAAQHQGRVGEVVGFGTSPVSTLVHVKLDQMSGMVQFELPELEAEG